MGIPGNSHTVLNEFTDFLEKHLLFLMMLGIAGIIINSLFYVQFTVDDAYISFRYAHNLINHGIWNWNPNHAAVEAYTSALYTFLAIIPELFGFNDAVFFKILGLIITAVLISRLKSNSTHSLGFVIAFLSIGLNFLFFIHVYSGLETVLYMFLLFELVRMFTTGKPVSERYLYCIMLLLPLTRPEGIIFSIAGFVWYVFFGKNRLKHPVFLSVIILIGSLYFFARYSYFDQLLPNPFYVKSVSGFGKTRLISNAFQVTPYFLLIGIITALNRNRALIYFSLTAAALYIVAYSGTEFYMNYADRFFVQLFFPIALVGIITMRDRVHILIAFIAVLFIISHKLADPDEVIKLMSYTPRSWQAHKKTGLILSDYRDRGYTLLLGDAGLISYYSGWVCYDYYGLADKEIAHNGISEKYLEDIHPDILFNNSKISLEQGIKVSKAERQTILNYIEDSGQYELVTDIRFDYDHYLHVYLRRDMQDFEEIARRLRERAEETHAFRLSRRTFFTFGYLLI